MLPSATTDCIPRTVAFSEKRGEVVEVVGIRTARRLRARPTDDARNKVQVAIRSLDQRAFAEDEERYERRGHPCDRKRIVSED